MATTTDVPNISGAASTITANNLTASRALISDSSGKVAVSAVTSTELGYVKGVSSSVQTQLNGKEPSFSKNTAFNKNFGSTAGTVTEGNDYRLSNARTPTAHTHDDRYYTEGEVDSKIFLKSHTDNRSVATIPNDYNSKFEIKGLKTNTVIGLTGGGAYSALLGIRGWTDSSGGEAHELAFDSSGRIAHRYGTTTAWNTWTTLIESNDSRLTDARTPKSHTHSASDISGRLGLGNLPTGTNGAVLKGKGTNNPEWGSVTWDEVSSKPTWIGSSKPSYTWSEIGSKPTNVIRQVSFSSGTLVVEVV